MTSRRVCSDGSRNFERGFQLDKIASPTLVEDKKNKKIKINKEPALRVISHTQKQV